MSSIGEDVEHLGLHTLLLRMKTDATVKKPWKIAWQNDLKLDTATSALTSTSSELRMFTSRPTGEYS